MICRWIQNQYIYCRYLTTQLRGTLKLNKKWNDISLVIFNCLRAVQYKTQYTNCLVGATLVLTTHLQTIALD